MHIDEIGDGLFEFSHASEDAANQALLGELFEEAFDDIEP